MFGFGTVVSQSNLGNIQIRGLQQENITANVELSNELGAATRNIAESSTASRAMGTRSDVATIRESVAYTSRRDIGGWSDSLTEAERNTAAATIAALGAEDYQVEKPSTCKCPAWMGLHKCRDTSAGKKNGSPNQQILPWDYPSLCASPELFLNSVHPVRHQEKR